MPIEPHSIQVEASSRCQLGCPACPTATGAARPVLGTGDLQIDNFEALLNRNPTLAGVELSNYGEMFLNPRLIDILRCAFEHNVVLHADNGVHLNDASGEVLEALVKYRFRSITCSIDGASAETYAQYRRNGNFDQVIANIREINRCKRAHHSGFPILRWQFIVFGHNEHEIAAARRLAGELEMSFYTKLPWSGDVSPVRNPELVRIQSGAPHATGDEYLKTTGLHYMRSTCYQMWRAPVVNWDGKMLGCSRNFWGDFGANVFNDGLGASVNSDRMNHGRQMLFGHAPARPDIPCTTCELFHTLRDTG
ncbi:MAG: radical SAM protein, partial [Bryobacteraceae bacterium]